MGAATSAGWGHRNGEKLAMGLVAPDCAVFGTPLSIEVLGEPVAAIAGDPCLYDPQNGLICA